MPATALPSQRRGAPGTGRTAQAGGRRRRPWSSGRTPYRPLVLCSGLLLATQLLANPPPGDTAQLQQLNRANAAVLGGIQSPPGRTPVATESDPGQRRLNRRQRAEQRYLQERQRRDLLLLNQRARTSARPAVPYRLQGIHLQRQYQLQQQNQLNRFRIQQGSPLR